MPADLCWAVGCVVRTEHDVCGRHRGQLPPWLLQSLDRYQRFADLYPRCGVWVRLAVRRTCLMAEGRPLHDFWRECRAEFEVEAREASNMEEWLAGGPTRAQAVKVLEELAREPGEA